MCASFAAHQQVPLQSFQGSADGAALQERATHSHCHGGCCGARQRGQTTAENELEEQLTIELLSSSGSSTPFSDDAAVADAAAAVAALICHEGGADDAAAAASQLFPAAQAITVRCPTASCPGQLTLALQAPQRGACNLTACTCSAADVLLRSAAASCTLDGSQASEAEQAALSALGEMLGQQLRHHVKQQVEVLHAAVASLRIQHPLGGHRQPMMGH